MKWLFRLVDRYTLWSSGFAWAERVLTDKSLVSSWSSTPGGRCVYELPAHIHIHTIPSISVNGCLAVRNPVRSGAGFQLQPSYFAFISTRGRVGAELRGEADGSSEFLVLLQLSRNWVDLNWAVR
eukprot:GFUD01050862.1.p1 GENE.GFUD01050862.1~~GFUD01050862.1.p1  ORF type:complete len:125 (+),score=1.70 GFUD01050862.1:384-758(+)